MLKLIPNFIRFSNRSILNSTFSICRYSYYSEVYKQSIENRDEFWAEAAKDIHWEKTYDTVVDDEIKHMPKWFKGGQMNMSYNCLDRHVKDGFGEQLAVIYDSPITGLVQRITYQELLSTVELLAGVLTKYGVKKGDCVLLYLPMVPQTLMTMLACARIGAVHSLVFGGFAAKELAVRIRHCQPVMMVTTNVGVEPGRLINYKRYADEAVSLAGEEGSCVRHCLVFNRPGHRKVTLQSPRDLDWDHEIHEVDPAPPVPVDSDHPLYLLYTSGTTGSPKGIIRPTGGYAVALKWSMSGLYGLKPGETWWAASDFGWVVGHSYICYAPLLHRCTTIIYEGKPVGTPDPGQYFRVLNWHRPVSLFVAPTALRAIRREDPQASHSKRYNFEQFRALFLAGEHCDVDTLNWSKSVFGVPVLDHWWQTETGWPITCPAVGLESRYSLQPPPGSAGRPVPGYDLRVLDHSSGAELPPGKLGRIAVKLPLPPGNASTLFRNEDKFREVYFTKFPGYYDTMDAGMSLEYGHLMVMARDDDVINVAGHRISSGALEEACLENEDVVECAVVGLDDPLKGQVPLGLIVPDNETTKPEADIVKETVALVRDRIGAVAAFKIAVVVHRLPKTRSGKVARKAIASMANGKPFKAPVTLEDPTVFDPIYNAFSTIGLKPSQPDDQ